MFNDFEKRPGMRTFIRHMSESRHIHLPPWAMIPKRIYDIASIIKNQEIWKKTTETSGIFARFAGRFERKEHDLRCCILSLKEAMATVVDGVTIKKEIEDPDSPDGQGQAENQNGQKLAKVWGDDETRSLIELAKVYIPKFKDSSYSKKQLLEDISAEMRSMGYDVTALNVHYKMKYLRAKYRNILNYNSKHVQKRDMPFHQALHELYSLDYFNDQDLMTPPTPELNGLKGKSKTVPASHVDLRAVVTSKKKKTATQVIHKGTKFVLKRKAGSKSRGIQPLFQCGLCMEKFQTSQDMHGHDCKNTKSSAEVKRKSIASVPATPTAATATPNGVFHWNSLMTMQLLELLKDYQDSHKNSNFRKGNLWDNMSTLMKRRGHNVHPKEIEKKWTVLTTAFEKTLHYNRTHKDKKKCAFFKRLSDLHRHPSSFACFRAEEPVKMTVEVSPFSFAASRSSLSQPLRPNKDEEEERHKNGGASTSSMPELMLWLENTWTEYKEMEQKREEVQAQRHHELMEMLSYLVEGSGKMDT
ncbi:hypothetical protein JTE90_019658 [Oedothorax gibbosus]|uniref:Myb/SANT-like DNA-binding domain-containing protein n=1 Tax=Oedothorax gibbosus TaxID=931172 RepID=A0AAV6U1Q7_9ARAC|nr:hypothetical protein JTE90_019658 [Oedothorax gibbosus]